jgi:hypothetical protein
METWEHMRVGAVQHQSQTVELWTVSGPRYFRRDRDVSPEPGDQGLALLDELGRQGWELVSTEQAPTGSAQLHTYWLKRRLIDEEPPGLAFGIA